MLVELAIAQICAGLPNLDYQACAKALEATSLQCNLKQDVDSFEKATYTYVYKKTSNVTGERVLIISGVALKVIRERAISYPLIKNPNGLVPAVTPSVSQKSGKIELRWKF